MTTASALRQRKTRSQRTGRVGAETVIRGLAFSMVLATVGIAAGTFTSNVLVAATNTEVRTEAAAPVVLISSISDSLDAEPAQTPEQEAKPPYSDEDVEAAAKMIYGEAIVTHSDTEMAAVLWCAINRFDSDDPYYAGCMSIKDIVTQAGQFHGYNEQHPVDEHIRELVIDVLDRWMQEKAGADDVGRVLPAEYLFFYGDGRHNHFTTEFGGGHEYDWSLPSPYEN